jgi:hypothetical protein
VRALQPEETMKPKTSLAAALIALAITGCAQIEPMVKYTHTSDIGRPNPEPTTDYAGVGVTLHWQYVEIDVSHGIRSRDCGALMGLPCNTEAGTEISTRIYPFRKQ